MLDSLIKKFPITARRAGGGGNDLPELLRDLLGEFGGATLSDGFYRFHTAESCQAGNTACAGLVRGFEGRFHVFAFDWLGRHLAVDLRPATAEGKVIAVDPGAAQHLATGCTFGEWHDAVAGRDDPLAYCLYQEWRDANPSAGALQFDQAIGYKVPVFLGGTDEVANLEIIDLGVYFKLCTQLARSARTTRAGSTIPESTAKRPSPPSASSIRLGPSAAPPRPRPSPLGRSAAPPGPRPSPASAPSDPSAPSSPSVASPGP